MITAAFGPSVRALRCKSERGRVKEKQKRNGRTPAWRNALAKAKQRKTQEKESQKISESGFLLVENYLDTPFNTVCSLLLTPFREELSFTKTLIEIREKRQAALQSALSLTS